jgi:hypothetical protein
MFKMDQWLLTMVTLWSLGYLDGDFPDDVPPWFKPPFWP